MGRMRDLLTTGEAAALLGSSRQHVVNLCDQAAIRYLTVGTHRRLYRRDIEAFASSGRPGRQHLAKPEDSPGKSRGALAQQERSGTNARRAQARIGTATKRRRRNPTSLDVARNAGVAPATAARVLGNYGSVSPQARARVLAAAGALGYRPNRLARSMATGSSRTIGVVVANIEDQFFARVVRGIADEARSARFEVILANSDENTDEELAAVHVLVEKQVDGLILAPADVRKYAHLAEVHRQGMPIVLLDRSIPEVAIDAVVVDGLRAADEATAYLIGRGHKRIAIVTDVPVATSLPSDFAPPAHAATAGARLAGYFRALQRAGSRVATELVCRAEPTIQGAREATLQLLDSDVAPTAIFATDNTMTIGVLEALQERLIRIPQDISLFGFDDLEWTRVVSPSLSVVSQPVYDLGATAARALLARINGNDGPARTYVLPTSLIHRASVAPRG